MRSDRRTAGTLALVALSFLVAAFWLAAQDDAEGGHGRLGGADGVAISADGDAGADAGDASPFLAHLANSGAAKRPRKRAAYVPTEDDRRRDAAREALSAAVVAQAAPSNVAAANLRRMALPGGERPTPANWTKAQIRLGGAATAVSATTLAARPGSRIRRSPSSGESYGDPSTDWEDPEAANPRRHGLRADYYDFLEGDLRQVPELAALPPTLTRVDAAIDFATDESFHLPFDPETFGVLWRGFLVVETAGEYEFTCGSDDGARLRIDGTAVLDHPWLRAYAETTGTVHLEPGRHEFELTFYENFVFASCRLFWKGPGIARGLVPATAFEPPDEIAAVDPPWLGTLDPPHGALGDEIVVTGGGFSATAALDRVTFAGVPAEIVEATPTRLVVKVPIGASTGNVVVQVGPLSTRPAPFEVDTLVGLYGEYFHIGTDISDLPDMDALAPYFVRLDGPLDFGDDDLWALPYEPDVFAARWSGFLYVPEEDEYEITLLSDDGAFVAIDGQRVVDLPGLHVPIEKSEVVLLSQGFHPIELRYFENYGTARLQLSWKRRGDATRTPIPRGFLFAPDALTARTEPRITALDPATAVSGEEIVVRGAGFGNDPRYVRVAFPDDVWVRPTNAADDLLRVRVPWGAGSGDLRVHVGVRPSAAVKFTLGEETGLRGDYFELGAGEGANAADLPALLASRTPSLTRIDRRLRFGKAADWNLPFAGRDFAVRWTGSIGTEIAVSLQAALQTESAGLLRVDGADVVADVHPHTLRERYGWGRLTPGEHTFELFTLHRGGDPRLHLFVTPFGRADHLEIPPNWLRPRPPR